MAPSTPEGRAGLVAWVRANRVGRAVMEASGGYERGWAERCARPVSKSGSWTRNGFATSPKRPDGWPRTIRSTPTRSPGSPRRFPTARPNRTIRTRRDRPAGCGSDGPERRGRSDQATGRASPAGLVAKALAAIAKTIRAELRKVEGAIAAKIKANPGFARRAEIVASVPGLADQTAAGVIAWMPELGHVTDEAAAALLGAAPYDDDSGERKGVRNIKGGRRKLRNLLYMPVMGAATRHNPMLKAYYQRLAPRVRKPRSPSSPACAS